MGKDKKEGGFFRMEWEVGTGKQSKTLIILSYKKMSSNGKHSKILAF